MDEDTNAFNRIIDGFRLPKTNPEEIEYIVDHHSQSLLNLSQYNSLRPSDTQFRES